MGEKASSTEAFAETSEMLENVSRAEKSNAARLFPYERWEPQLKDLAGRYQRNAPFPNIELEKFLNEETARRAMVEFPGPRDTNWVQYKHFNENKMGKAKRAEFPPLLGALVDEFNSPRFVRFLSELVGIPNLLADPALDGGGMHQTEAGGFLNVHADFTMHHQHLNWRRRCNLILYLNENWNPQWRGALELWDAEVKHCVTRIEPVLNRAAIFNTDEVSFHGYPDPIACPPEVTRKSLALYYYTAETGTRHVARSTNYQPRPGDGARGLLIWLDKQAVHFYSLVKTRLNLSDDFASKVLGYFARKK